jgi:hypothetical protein
MRTRINLDQKLDSELNMMLETFWRQGYRNIKKKDLLRLLIEDYRKRGSMRIVRQPKSKNWRLL